MRAATIVVCSIVVGVAEASVLFLLVRLSTALAAGTDVIDIHVGPVDLAVEDRGLLMVAIGSLLVTALVMATLSARSAARLVADSMSAARLRLVGAYLSTTWESQSRQPAGRLNELSVNYTNHLANSLQATTMALTALVNLTIYVLVSISIQPVAFIVLIGAAVALAALLSPVRRAHRRASLDNQTTVRAYNQSVADITELACEVSAFGVADTVTASLRRPAEAAADALYRLRFLMRVQPFAFQYSALALATAGLALAPVGDDAAGAQFGTVVVLLVRSLSFIQQINGAWQTLQESSLYVGDLTSAIDEFEDLAPALGSAQAPARPDLELEGVAYRYAEDAPVLEDVSLHIPFGQCIGLIGPSGGGKTTLLQVLVRLREPSAGRVLLGGRPAGEVSRESWSEAVAYAPQDSHLFLEAVGANIAFFRPLDEAAVQDAAEKAHLDEVIRRLPHGMDTVIGRSARELSGGQRQRVALARALAGGPKVLVLDEPTSALDATSEAYVADTIASLKGQVTVVIAAHRLSTMQICDRLVVIRDGRVDADDSPEALAATAGFFGEVLGFNTGDLLTRSQLADED